MEFDIGEFGAGAARALALHVVLLLLTSELTSIAVGVMTSMNAPERGDFDLGNALGLPILVMLYGVPISLIATLTGLVPAYLLGRALVRVRSFRTHLQAWSAFGIVFSGLVSLVVALLFRMPDMTLISAFSVAGFASGAVAIPAAWARTASKALRKDQGVPSQRSGARRARPSVSPSGRD